MPHGKFKSKRHALANKNKLKKTNENKDPRMVKRNTKVCRYCVVKVRNHPGANMEDKIGYVRPATRIKPDAGAKVLTGPSGLEDWHFKVSKKRKKAKLPKIDAVNFFVPFARTSSIIYV